MRNAFAIFALGAAASVAGCAVTSTYKVPRDAEPTSDAVEAAGDTSVTRRHSTDVHTLRPHGCVGPVPV